jgi:hypothetical protein
MVPVRPALPLSSPSPNPSALTRLRALQSVHLRQKPDPVAPDVFGLADQSIPEGSQITLPGDCQVWMGSGRGEQDADNVWCPVIYGNYRGWANAYYLETNEGQRFACVHYPEARGCPPRQSPQQAHTQKLNATITKCVQVLRAAGWEFDAFYNPATGQIEQVGNTRSFFLFRKCMVYEGSALGNGPVE